MQRPSIVTLEEILDNREERAKRQQALLAAHVLPLVSFTVNMPGPVKDNAASRTIFRQGLEALQQCCEEHGWKVVALEEHNANTGPEALCSIDCNAKDLKTAMTALENKHPLGRLFDLDVLSSSGEHLSRRDTGAPVRLCLICERPAVECARSRAHSLDELLHAIEKRVDKFSAP